MMSTREEHVVLSKLKDLGIHETMAIDSEVSVMRVPGGLIYTFVVRSLNEHGNRIRTVSSTFVPFP